jgi:hypothetical protein
MSDKEIFWVITDEDHDWFLNLIALHPGEPEEMVKVEYSHTVDDGRSTRVWAEVEEEEDAE